MKIRASIILFVTTATVLIIFLLWYRKEKEAITPQMSSLETTNLAQPAPGEPILSPSTPVHTNIQIATSTKGEDLSKNPPLSKEERAIGLLSDYNDQLIVFYGKIEDQFSNAIANATVNFGVRIINGYESTVKRGQVTSDANGLFTISGYKGQDLGIGVEKSGYVFVSMNGSGIYSKMWPEDQRAHPDENNPTIIKMWKLQGGEPLIHFSYSARLPYDGTPITFDFHSGKIVNSGGDLIIRLKCPIKSNTSQQYDWEAIIQPVDGGIVSSDSGMELQFQAPDSGYDSEYDIKNAKDVKPWSSAFHGGFYLKSRGGSSYGKFDLGIVIYAIKEGLVPITIEGYINPAGSRNLEIDPAKVTEAHP